MTTRVLYDSHDLMYDIADMLSAARDGEAWTDRWNCDDTRSTQVGDRVYVLSGTPADPLGGYLARGTVVAATGRDQLRNTDARFADLSEAHCTDPYDLPGDVLRVRFALDSVVDIEHTLTLKRLAGHLTQTAPDLTRSGQAIPDDYATALDHQWEEHLTRKPKRRKAHRVTGRPAT